MNEEIQEKVKALVEEHGSSQVRASIYTLARNGELTVELILFLQELNNVESLDG